MGRRLLATVEISAATLPPAFRTGIALWVGPVVALASVLAATVLATDRRARSFRSRLISELTRSRRVGSPIFCTLVDGERGAPAAHSTLGPTHELGPRIVLIEGHAALRACDFFQAMLRDVTHRKVASEGGWGVRSLILLGGQWPNFSLNLWPTQPGL